MAGPPKISRDKLIELEEKFHELWALMADLSHDDQWETKFALTGTMLQWCCDLECAWHGINQTETVLDDWFRTLMVAGINDWLGRNKPPESPFSRN